MSLPGADWILQEHSAAAPVYLQDLQQGAAGRGGQTQVAQVSFGTPWLRGWLGRVGCWLERAGWGGGGGTAPQQGAAG